MFVLYCKVSFQIIYLNVLGEEYNKRANCINISIYEALAALQ